MSVARQNPPAIAQNFYVWRSFVYVLSSLRISSCFIGEVCAEKMFGKPFLSSRKSALLLSLILVHKITQVGFIEMRLESINISWYT
jgi:hypothetical protein